MYRKTPASFRSRIVYEKPHNTRQLSSRGEIAVEVIARRASSPGCGIHEGPGATTICRDIGKKCYPISAVELRDLSTLPSEGTRTSDGRLTQRASRFVKAPFTYTGVEYFGPLYVTVRRSAVKIWGFLFTCMTTRVAHIEVPDSLDRYSCVMGIARFIARRGRPSVKFSDNGSRNSDKSKAE